MEEKFSSIVCERLEIEVLPWRRGEGCEREN